MPRSAARESVQSEYAALAPEYDARWSAYLRRTVRPLLAELPDRPGLRLLDVGCGTGVLLARVLHHHPTYRCAGVDVSEPMLRRATERLGGRVRLVRAGADQLPFADRHFDLVVSSSSLHYWPHPQRALGEIARVLRPGGRLALVDWSADFLAIRALTAWLRFTRRPLGRVFQGAELEGCLRDAGFVDSRTRPFRAGVWGMMLVAARRPDGRGDTPEERP